MIKPSNDMGVSDLLVCWTGNVINHKSKLSIVVDFIN